MNKKNMNKKSTINDYVDSLVHLINNVRSVYEINSKDLAERDKKELGEIHNNIESQIAFINEYLQQDNLKSDDFGPETLDEKFRTFCNKFRYDLFGRSYLHDLIYEKGKSSDRNLFIRELVNLLSDYFEKKESLYVSPIPKFRSKGIVKNESGSIMTKEFKVDTTTVSCLCEYLRYVNILATGKSRLFYRGHGNSSYFLKPGTHRDKLVDEKTIILDYEHFAPAHDLKREKDIDMLIDMQHYEIPTRLLDWSLSPLYALFFACYDELGTNNENDAEVFIFDPWKYNNLIIDYKSKPHPKIHDIHIYARVLLAKGYNLTEVNNAVFKKYDYKSLTNADLKLPFAMVGDYHNPRNQSQKGTFTIQGSDERDIISLLHEYKDFPSEFSSIYSDKNNIEDILKIIRIPSSAKKRILEELNILNIHPYSIYPDPHGMSRYLKSNPQGFFKSRKM